MRLSLRLGLILAVTLALIAIVLVVALVFSQRNLRAYGVVLPLPAQTAAIVELVEKTPEDSLPLALRALTTPELGVSILDKPPPSRGTLPMPGMSLAMRTYLSALGGRPVSAMVELERTTQPSSILLSANEARASRPVRLLIGMRNGKTLMIEAHSAMAERFTGMRLALLALLATLVIGAASFWVLDQQLKPLERLAAAVEKFGQRLEISSLREEGTTELRQLIAAFNRLQTNIGELVNGRTRMLAAIGHDLGTYLTRLRLRVEFIADENQRAHAIRDIDDMHKLMDDTLELAKFEYEGEKADMFDLNSVLRRQIEAYAESGAKVSMEAAPASVMVNVAPTALQRAVGNLISNALKYGGEAKLSVLSGDGRAEIRVEDRGPGIPPEERLAVLEPFYRRDAARNLNEGGFGLGLAIVADIVKRAGGSLKFEDREGGGLRVRLFLPLAHA